MTDPTRLVDTDANETERALLVAGATEQPSDRAIHQAALAISVAVGVSTAATGASAAAAASKVAVWSAGKWVAGGLLAVGGLSLAAYQLATTPAAPQGGAAQAGPAASIPALKQAQGPGKLQGRAAVHPAAPPEPAASDPEPHVAPRAQPAAAARGADSKVGSIRAQIAVLDSAREKLRSGDASGALRELDRYASRFPRGSLGQEATVLRIEALAKSGNRAKARNLAERVLARQPSTQYRRRIESIVGPIGNQQSSTRQR